MKTGIKNSDPKRLKREPLSAIIDFSAKRRSNSVESTHEEKGKPFITPFKANCSRPKKYFFLQKDSLSPNFLISQINQLSSAQAFKISLTLNLRPFSQASLVNFISQISCTDHSMLERVQTAIYSVTQQRSVHQQHIQAPAPSFPYIDIRYFGESSSLFGPFEIGHTEFQFQFVLPQLPEKTHLIAQCFLYGVSPPTYRWPTKLSIIVDDIPLKVEGPFYFPVIDFHPFGVGKNVILHGAPEGFGFTLLIRQAKYRSIKSILLQIQNNPGMMEMYNGFESSLLCPISGNLMEHPGRGRDCSHDQCFDLKEFLKRAIYSLQNTCPVCGTPLSIENLIYSHQTKKAIYNMKASSSDILALTPNESSDDLFQPSVFDESDEQLDFI